MVMKDISNKVRQVRRAIGYTVAPTLLALAVACSGGGDTPTQYSSGIPIPKTYPTAIALTSGRSVDLVPNEQNVRKGGISLTSVDGKLDSIIKPEEANVGKYTLDSPSLRNTRNSDDYILVVVDMEFSYSSGKGRDAIAGRRIEDIIKKTIERQMPIVTLELNEGATAEPYKSLLGMYSLNAYVQKNEMSGFTNPKFEDKLRELGHKRLLIVGAVESACVKSTAIDAIDRGYDVVLSDETNVQHDLGRISTMYGKVNLWDYDSSADYSRILNLVN